MTADYTPTPEQVEAFKKAWHEADAEGDEGNRVSRGLAAALAQRDVELRAEVERLRAVSAAQPYETERELAVALDEARRQLANLRAGIEALLPGETVNIYAGGGNLVSQRRVVDPDHLRTLLAGSGEQPGERDATPDEAHDIGYAKGHTDGYREALAEHPAPAVPDSPDVLRAKASAAVAVLHAEKFRELGRLATADEVTDAVLAVVGQGVTAEAVRARLYTPEGQVRQEVQDEVEAAIRRYPNMDARSWLGGVAAVEAVYRAAVRPSGQEGS